MLIERFKRTIERYRLLDRGDRVVVGVSGGMDSMVLVHLLSVSREEYSLSLIVAHVNHGLRPEESLREAKLVERVAGDLGLPFEQIQFETREFQKRSKLSLQDAARRLRFHFFRELLTKYGAQKIALGHNADDQVETVLIRLLRGSGARGLKGMMPLREGRVIHPLLESWRTEIEDYAKFHHIPFLQDSSNLKSTYLRNRIRRHLIPLLEKDYQPNLKLLLQKTSHLIRDEDDFLEKEADKAYRQMIREEREGLSFSLATYREHHPVIRWRLILKVLQQMDSDQKAPEEGEPPSTAMIYDRLHGSEPCFLLELPTGGYIERCYETVFLRKGKVEPTAPFEMDVASPGTTTLREVGKEVIIEVVDRRGSSFKPGECPPNVAFFDYQCLHFPLRMRNFRPGDRFQPLGVKGTQKLKEFFVDHKIPRHERPNVPLLISGEVIAWVAGYRIDERVRVTEKTEKVLRAEIRSVTARA